MSTLDVGNLPAATDAPKSRRGRKPGSAAKVRAQLPAEAFKMETVPEDERGSVRRIRVERDAQQVAIDLRVLEVYRQWVAAGKPAKWVDMPVTRWPLDAKYVEDALFFLHKGADLHGKKLVLGNVSNKGPDGKRYMDGLTRIPFCVIDRSRKDKTPAASAEDSVAE